MVTTPPCVPLFPSGFRRFLDRTVCSSAHWPQRLVPQRVPCRALRVLRNPPDGVGSSSSSCSASAPPRRQGSRLSFSRSELSASNSNSSPTPPEPFFQEQGRSCYPVHYDRNPLLDVLLRIPWAPFGVFTLPLFHASSAQHPGSWSHL